MRKFEEILKTWEAEDDDNLIFLMIDEFHYALAIEAQQRPQSLENPNLSALSELRDLLKRYPRLRLIATCHEQALVDMKHPTQQNWFKTLFPEDNRVRLVTSGPVSKKIQIQMLNSGLNSAGFKDMPDWIKEKTRKLPDSLNTRRWFQRLYQLLKDSPDHEDQPDEMQEVPHSVWKKLIPAYLQND